MFANTDKHRKRSSLSLNNFINDYNNQNYDLNYPTPKLKADENSVMENSHSCWQYVFKLVVMVGCVLGCAWQCIAILNLFFSFPSIVFVYVETMDQLFLPGITLCNSNRYTFGLNLN